MQQLAIMMRVCQIWRNDIDEYVSAQTMQVFTHIAMFPNISATEIQQATGLSQSGVSRHCMALSPVNRYRKAGYGLIDEAYDPYERRRKMYKLTAKGLQFKQKLEGVFDMLCNKKEETV